MTWHEGVRRPAHEEFIGWTSAQKIEFPAGSAFQDRLIAHLKRGEVEAAANANWSEGAGKYSFGPLVMLSRWWSNVDSGHPSHYANLWKTGQIELYVPHAKTGVITRVLFSSVRLKPSELALALDPTAPLARAAPKVPAGAQAVEWISAQHALTLFTSDLLQAMEVKKAIVAQAAGGLVRTRCRRKISYGADFLGRIIPGTEHDIEDDCQIEPSIWAGVKTDNVLGGGNWDQGIFDAVIGSRREQKVCRLLQVQFCKADILAMPGAIDVPPGISIRELAANVGLSVGPAARQHPSDATGPRATW